MEPLYLADIKFDDFNKTEELPLINNWCWSISGDGTGCLLSPDNTKYCMFDIMAGTLQFKSDSTKGSVAKSLNEIQTIGETYADKCLFSKEEHEEFAKYLKNRGEQTTARKKEIYNKIQGSVTLSYDAHGNWQTLVDTEKVKELSGIISEPVLQGKDAGINLFNRIAETMMSNSSLKDPCGYMKKPDNIYDMMRKEYEQQYDSALAAVENGILDGTGYALQSVLDNIQKTVRSDVCSIVPGGEKYGDLRFVTPTEEQKKLGKDMVKARLALSLIFEKKRSYDDATIEKAKETLKKACNALSDSIYGDGSMTKKADEQITM